MSQNLLAPEGTAEAELGEDTEEAEEEVSNLVMVEAGDQAHSFRATSMEAMHDQLLSQRKAIWIKTKMTTMKPSISNWPSSNSGLHSNNSRMVRLGRFRLFSHSWRRSWSRLTVL